MVWTIAWMARGGKKRDARAQPSDIMCGRSREIEARYIEMEKVGGLKNWMVTVSLKKKKNRIEPSDNIRGKWTKKTMRRIKTGKVKWFEKLDSHDVIQKEQH